MTGQDHSHGCDLRGVEVFGRKRCLLSDGVSENAVCDLRGILTELVESRRLLCRPELTRKGGKDETVYAQRKVIDSQVSERYGRHFRR